MGIHSEGVRTSNVEGENGKHKQTVECNFRDYFYQELIIENNQCAENIYFDSVQKISLLVTAKS
jgi:hypothetical protein